MTSLIFFIERAAFGLYFISLAGLLFNIWRFIGARRELTVSQFRFEREFALVRQARSVTAGVLLIEFMVAVWAVSTLMAPTVRDIRTGENQSVAAPAEFVTSTPANNPPPNLDPGIPQAEGPDVFATPIPTATPVGTIIPDAPDVVGCARDRAWLLVPGNGQLIFESTVIYGTANISNFSRYRFEMRLDEPGTNFAPISGDTIAPVIEGPLGTITPLDYALGQYRFRLVVFDNTNTVRALCEITIFIGEPPPTPTPLVAQPDAE